MSALFRRTKITEQQMSTKMTFSGRFSCLQSIKAFLFKKKQKTAALCKINLSFLGWGGREREGEKGEGFDSVSIWDFLGWIGLFLLIRCCKTWRIINRNLLFFHLELNCVYTGNSPIYIHARTYTYIHIRTYTQKHSHTRHYHCHWLFQLRHGTP